MLLQGSGQRLPFAQTLEQAVQHLGGQRTAILRGQGFQPFDDGQSGLQQGE